MKNAQSDGIFTGRNTQKTKNTAKRRPEFLNTGGAQSVKKTPQKGGFLI